MTTATLADGLETTWPVQGMTCVSCVGRVEKALRQVPDVLDVAVNLASEVATVTLAQGTSADPLAAAVKKAGYGVRAPVGAAVAAAPWLSEGRRVVLAALLSAPLVMQALFDAQPRARYLVGTRWEGDRVLRR